MNAQEAFDTAVRGLASQGFRRSVASDGESCMYNGPDGRHCALGWLIVDVEIDKGDNSAPSGSIMINYPEVRKKFEGINDPMLFVRTLQTCHDSAYIKQLGASVDKPSAMVENLRAFASRDNLDTSVLDAAALELGL